MYINYQERKPIVRFEPSGIFSLRPIWTSCTFNRCQYARTCTFNHRTIRRPKSYPADIWSLYLTPHIHPTDLQETPMNDLNNPVLLLRSHLVITGKTQPSPENISSYVHSRAWNISICASSAVSFDCDERVRPVDRLHMHGLHSPSSCSLKCKCNSL